MKSKKIIYINSAINRLSTGRIVEQTGILAQSQGWECYAVYNPRYNAESCLHTIPACTLLEEKSSALQSRIFDNHGLAIKNATKRLIKIIDDIHPNIVHLHNIHGYHINYKVLFEYLNSHPIHVVWTLHDCWSFTGHCTYFDMIDCKKWKTGCFSCPQKREYPQSLLLDRSRRNWNLKKNLYPNNELMTLVPVSNWLEDLCKTSFWGQEGKVSIKTIHNGIDIETFTYSEVEANRLKRKHELHNKKILLAVANGFGKRKGFKDIVSMSTMLPDYIKIIMVGVSESEFSQLPKGILGVRRTENLNELVGYYSLADIFINPTYEDNFPTTNLEALACGTPVITYDTGGSPEAINKETGMVVEKGNVTAFVDSILRMLNSPLSSTSCQKRAEGLFNKDICFNKYIELYNKLLDNNHALIRAL